MAHVFTPGLQVTGSTTVRRIRRLPLRGKVRVKQGDEVRAHTVVAETQLPGKVFPLNLGNLLHVEPGDVAGCMRVQVGTKFPKGVVLAETAGVMGMFRTSVKSPVAATLESVSELTGQVMLREPPTPIELSAYVDGTVVDVLEDEGAVIETSGAFVQGIFGLGGEVNGELAVVGKGPDATMGADDLGEAHRGKVVLAGAGLDGKAFKRAAELGVAAVIVGGFSYHGIKDLLGYEVGVAITGTEDLGTTLVLTEGFGDIAMAKATYELLASHEGDEASVNGATQIRAGVIRPEVIIPSRGGSAAKAAEGGGLQVGSRVRGIRAPFFGHLGKVTALPPELQTMPSETKVRVLEVQFDDGQTHTLPRANVEAIEG